MRLFLLFLLASLSFFSCSEEKVEWIDFEYDTAFAYYFDNESSECTTHDGILIDGKMNPSVINPKGEKLSVGQIVEVSRAMGGQYSDEIIERKDCYLPHHGILFYHQGKIVADISICFQCNQVKSHPKAGNVDVNHLKMIFIHREIPIEYEDFPHRPGPFLQLDSLKTKP